MTEYHHNVTYDSETVCGYTYYSPRDPRTLRNVGRLTSKRLVRWEEAQVYGRERQRNGRGEGGGMGDRNLPEH